MPENNRGLKDDDLAKVNGGTGTVNPNCKRKISRPNGNCKDIGCPYCTNVYCSLYEKYLSGSRTVIEVE